MKEDTETREIILVLDASVEGVMQLPARIRLSSKHSDVAVLLLQQGSPHPQPEGS